MFLANDRGPGLFQGARAFRIGTLDNSDEPKHLEPQRNMSEEAMNNFTPRAQQVLALARKEADRLNHNFVGTEHLLLGLLREGDGVAARVLKNLDVDIEQTRQEILKELDPNFAAQEEGASGESSSEKPAPEKK